MATLMTPLALGGVAFRNRIVVQPMCRYAATDGFATDWHVDRHARFALGGLGGVLVEATGNVPRRPQP